ncbi:MAG: DUF732 domain-containing protein [Candidatus Nanopelagicales bacterium]
MRTKRFMLPTIPVGLAAASIIAAPNAQADQWDYVSYLDNNGVAYSSMLGVISLGKQVCHEFRTGTSLRAVGSYLTGPLGYSGAEAGAIVIGASRSMCPDTISAIASQVDSLGGTVT